MRSSCALVLPALVCISCASAQSPSPVESPRLPALAEQARAASRTGQSERAASLWEQVLAANPPGAIRTRALWGAAEARLTPAAGGGRNTPAARRHLQELADREADADTRQAIGLAIRALDHLSALESEHVVAVRDRERLRADLEQRNEALRKAAATLLDPKKPE
jgi:hypothetical protein